MRIVFTERIYNEFDVFWLQELKKQLLQGRLQDTEKMKAKFHAIEEFKGHRYEMGGHPEDDGKILVITRIDEKKNKPHRKKAWIKEERI